MTVVTVLTHASTASQQDMSNTRGFDIIPPQDVQVTSTFWSRVQKNAREISIPASIKAQKDLAHWYCLTWKRDHPIKPHAFWDSDIYKIVEAACYFLQKHEDAALSAAVDDAVDMIEKAQYEDGYISSYFTVHGIEKRWTNTRDLHELYCIGHFLEAAVAYETLTKNGRLLKVARKVIAHVDSVFGVDKGKKPGYPGHQEIEIGLLRFFELTQDPSALKLAEYFIFQRGTRDDKDEIYWDSEARSRGADPYDDLGSEHKGWYHGTRDYGYHQADCQLVDATEVKGHSVRAFYYYTAATNLLRTLSKDDARTPKLEAALKRLWKDLVDKKIYVTGGAGSVRQWEGFGPAYSLNDDETDGCYSETCAAFALINWCQSLLRLQLVGEYADVMETVLYNAFLGAVSADGDAFYYQNVLRTSAGKPKDRSKWFGVACCPPNVSKLVGSMQSLIYSVQPEEDFVAIHLFVDSSVTLRKSNATVTQHTNMPWSGQVGITVHGTVKLALHIPGWARDTFTCSTSGELSNGYLYLPTLTDTEIQLSFSLTPRRIYAHPSTNKDEICIARGPLIYCFEDADNHSVAIDHMLLVDSAPQDGGTINIGQFKDVQVVTARARPLLSADTSSLYTSSPWRYSKESVEVKAVPYFLRANRGGNGAMRVWTRRSQV